jgi:hypothetical protein
VTVGDWVVVDGADDEDDEPEPVEELVPVDDEPLSVDVPVEELVPLDDEPVSVDDVRAEELVSVPDVDVLVLLWFVEAHARLVNASADAAASATAHRRRERIRCRPRSRLREGSGSGEVMAARVSRRPQPSPRGAWENPETDAGACAFATVPAPCRSAFPRRLCPASAVSRSSPT